MPSRSSRKMAGSAKLRQLKSSWTPLSNEEQNHKMFEERRDLVNKWFDKWSDAQRKLILDDLVSRCKVKQLVYADELVSKKKPVFHLDPTTLMPRALTVYMFSFLDPRTLCRCAQVSWNWKNIAELDQLWMPKAVRRGWILTFSPSPYELGTWKRLYIENASNLKFFGKPKEMPDTVRSGLNKYRPTDRSRRGVSPRSRPASATGKLEIDEEKKPLPWKGSDPTPTDTWRNNYLENEDEVSKIRRLRRKGLHGAEAGAITQNAKNKVNTGSHVILKSPSNITRSKSALSLREAKGVRPDWAKPTQNELDLTKISMDSTVSRPAPVVTLKPSKTVTLQKEETLSEKEEGFQGQPWQIPNDGYDST